MKIETVIELREKLGIFIMIEDREENIMGDISYEKEKARKEDREPEVYGKESRLKETLKEKKEIEKEIMKICKKIIYKKG